MKTISVLHRPDEPLSGLIQKGLLDANERYLIRMYTATLEKDEAVALARKVKGLFPFSEVFGASAMGLIFHDQLYERETMLLFDQLEQTDFSVTSLSWADRSPQAVAQEFAALAYVEGAQLVHVLFSDRYTRIQPFTEEVNRLMPGLQMVGGIAGDVSETALSFVFDDQGVKPRSLMIASLQGKGLAANAFVNIAHEPITEVFTITKARDDVIEEIEHCDAKAWVKELLGLEKLSSYQNDQLMAANDEIARFPLILEGHHGAAVFCATTTSRMKLTHISVRWMRERPSASGIRALNTLPKTPLIFCGVSAFNRQRACFSTPVILGNCILTTAPNGRCHPTGDRDYAAFF